MNKDLNSEEQDWKALTQELNQAYGLMPVEKALQRSAEKCSEEELEALLAEKLNILIRDDFQGFIRLLYQIDIDESALKRLLKKSPGEDAGKIIAPLIIQRQLQKIRTRRQYPRGRSGGSKSSEGTPEWKDV